MERENRVAGFAAGLIGGLVGSWTMTEFSRAWSRAVDGAEPVSAGEQHDAREWQERSKDENANEIMAQRISQSTLGRRLSREELKVAAPAVHYAFGATMGALYGAAAEATPVVTMGVGGGFGTAVWLGADEIAMPLFGLERDDITRGVEPHLQAFAAHIVYGVTTEVVRRAVRALI
ncbi:MAG TPA: DUF1440 domain-containing protein [Vicinamibacterales bacterium]|nr:DUF1440 domain-containing protein [Vicinamibacterales bacterium]